MICTAPGEIALEHIDVSISVGSLPLDSFFVLLNDKVVEDYQESVSPEQIRDVIVIKQHLRLSSLLLGKIILLLFR